MIRRVSDAVIRPSGVKAGVRARVRQLGTHSEGGVFQELPKGCSTAIFLMLLCCRGLSATTRPDRATPEVRGGTGATPPFLPLVRHAGRGGVPGGVPMGVPPPPPPFGGRSRPYYPCGKAPILNPLGR